MQAADWVADGVEHTGGGDGVGARSRLPESPAGAWVAPGVFGILLRLAGGESGLHDGSVRGPCAHPQGATSQGCPLAHADEPQAGLRAVR